MESHKDAIAKKLRALQKRATKITATEAVTTTLNADQKDLLSKKEVTKALIAELQDQLAMFASLAAQTPAAAPAAPAIVAAVQPVASTTELDLATTIKSLETAVAASHNATASLFKSISILCDDLLTTANLSEYNFTLLKSVQALVLTSSDIESVAAHLSTIVNAPRPVPEKDAHVKQDSQETFIEGAPCFMNASQIEIVTAQNVKSVRRGGKNVEVGRGRGEIKREAGKVVRKALQTVEEPERVTATVYGVNVVEVVEVVEEKPKRKTMSFVVGANGGLKRAEVGV